MGRILLLCEQYINTLALIGQLLLQDKEIFNYKGEGFITYKSHLWPKINEVGYNYDTQGECAIMLYYVTSQSSNIISFE